MRFARRKHSPRGTREPRLVLMAVMLGTFSVSLNNSALNLAVAELMVTFETGAVEAGWVVTLFLLAMAMTMPLSGFLADRHGRRRLYLVGLTLFLMGSLVGALASGLSGVLVARGVQGIAAGLMIPLSLPLLYGAFGEGERGRVTGLWGAAAMIAPALGPPLGGLLLELGHWQWLFIMNLPSALVALVLAYRYLPASTTCRQRRFDWPGFVLITFGMLLLMLALGGIGGVRDLRDPVVVAGLAGGVTALVVFVLVQRRVAYPLLDLGIFRRPRFAVSVVIACAQAVATFGCLLLVPLWMQVQGHSAWLAGLVFLPAALASAVISPMAGRWIDRRSPLLLLTTGLVLTAASLAGFSLLGPAVPLGLVVMLMAARGLGLGLSYLPATALGLQALPSSRHASASAQSNIARRLTSALGVVALSVFYELRSVSLRLDGMSTSAAGLSALAEAFAVLALIVLAVVPLAWSLRAEPRRQPRTDAVHRV